MAAEGPPGRPPRPAGERRAWGWVAHLRDGGTTPWCDWSAPAEPAGLFLPGAQQLELLRRINLASDRRIGPDLSRRVLEASAPGRGRPDLELVGASSGSDFGPRPVDPSDLPAEELIRVAVGLVADDLTADSPVSTGDSVWVRPWRTRYRLVGDPWVTDVWRDDLRRRGRPPGGATPRIVVVGGALDALLANTYAARAFDTGVPSWADWVGAFAARNTLAPRVDLAQVADNWARRSSAGSIRVVLDPRVAPRLLGVRRLPKVEPPGATGVELARLVASVLGLSTTPARRTALLRGVLAPRIRQAGAGARLAVPEEHRDWLTTRADRMYARLTAADYPVDGGPADLAPALEPGVTTPERADVLRLAMRLLTMRDLKTGGNAE